MARPVADRALLDTNVLLAATDQGRPDHLPAKQALDTWPGDGMALYTSGQVLREYLVVATRPVEVNGLGLARRAAIGNVRLLRDRLRVLGEGDKVTARLLALLQEIDCTGKRIHDANLVATVLEHGIGTIVTLNVDDFVDFAAHVEVLHLPP